MRAVDGREHVMVCMTEPAQLNTTLFFIEINVDHTNPDLDMQLRPVTAAIRYRIAWKNADGQPFQIAAYDAGSDRIAVLTQEGVMMCGHPS